MKNIKEKKYLFQAILFMGLFSLFAFASCNKEEEPAEDPIASFQYQVSEENYLMVMFMNFSLNAETYSWNFGDGNTSTEENPTHTFSGPGVYEVVLTATNKDGVGRSFSEVIELQDPLWALKMLAGETSKTWKLYRVGTSLGVGESVANPRGWWALENDGSRPCVYFHEFTFHRNGNFVFDDKGFMWGEEGVYHEDLVGECLEAIPANMVGPNGEDLSPWLGNTHSFEFNTTTNKVTITGMGAWMGIVKVATQGEVTVPQSSVSFTVELEERDGYDYMHVLYIYDWGVWSFSYAHYHDPSAEPEVVEEEEIVEDLPHFAPPAFFNTFASTDAADVQYLIPTESDVTITVGVEDPADASATLVGQYDRGTNMYADLKFKMDFNILFDNFTTVSLDVFVPGTNDFTGGLDKSIMIWIADAHTTQNFWESWVMYLVPDEDVVLDQWVTYTFQLAEPSEGSTGNAIDRTDLDLVGLTIGGGGHAVDATFYIRNFKFE